MHIKGPARDLAHKICQPLDTLIGGTILNPEFRLKKLTLTFGVQLQRETKSRSSTEVHQITNSNFSP